MIQRTLDINILANFQIIKKVAIEMIAAGRQGRMVMCSSGHGTMEQNRLSQSIPIGRSAQADEIAAVIEFLLGDQASYVVGSLYTADGGFFLHPNPSA